MADTKYPFPGRTQDPSDTVPKGERRRLSRIVHDHKGNATVEWLDAPGDYERPLLEIEGSRQPAAPPTKRAANAGSLHIESADSHNPYTRIPETERKGGSGTRTDLRKLSAWIKMMRALEEAKKNKDEE
jgi:hypothetical protein